MYNITNKLIDLCNAYKADGEDKAECWLVSKGSSIKVTLYWNGSLLYISYNSFSNRVIVNNKGEVVFSNFPKIVEVMKSSDVGIQ